jgi:tartrate dehydrogenase/decarboxylase/D-malate dehydrogenase
MSINHRIAVAPGDGIGKEIIPVTLEVLQAAIESTESRIDTTEFPFDAGHYKTHGTFMPADGLEILRPFDAILFGAVGLPEVDDTLPAKEYTFKIRCALTPTAARRTCFPKGQATWPSIRAVADGKAESGRTP